MRFDRVQWEKYQDSRATNFKPGLGCLFHHTFEEPSPPSGNTHGLTGRRRMGALGIQKYSWPYYPAFVRLQKQGPQD